LRSRGMKVPGGYIVAIEGIDAVGKKTQTELLSRWLKAKGVEGTTMGFPDYLTRIGKEIRAFLDGRARYPPQVQHLLFAANRWEKRAQIEDHLRAGKVVVIDRYTESNLAYGAANGLDIGWLEGLERGLPKADLVLVLDAQPKSVVSRRPGRSKDAYERSDTVQSRAQNAYRRLARERGWELIEAERPLREVQKAVAEAVKEALKRDRGISL